MITASFRHIAGIGGLMATAMKSRGLAGAVIDAGVRDTPQIRKLQFPVFSRGIVPSTSINHYRFAGWTQLVQYAGVSSSGGISSVGSFAPESSMIPIGVLKNVAVRL